MYRLGTVVDMYRLCSEVVMYQLGTVGEFTCCATVGTVGETRIVQSMKYARVYIGFASTATEIDVIWR